MESKKKIAWFDFILLWGFILFNLGILGLLQIAILEGLPVFFLISGITCISGIIILIALLMLNKKGRF